MVIQNLNHLYFFLLGISHPLITQNVHLGLNLSFLVWC